MKTSLHTHTNFCDGENSIEEMVQAAISKKYDVIGFTGHAYLKGEGYCMSLEGTDAYFAEIERVKTLYTDKIQVLNGLEIDYLSDIPDRPLDIYVGSVHYVDRIAYCVDDTPIKLATAIKEFSEGDVKHFIREYYKLIVKNAQRLYTYKQQHPDTICIIGHFDLIKKHNRDNRYFDENSDWYKEAAIQAAEKCCLEGLVVEINTGGITRGYRDDPYPSDFLLDVFRKNNIEIIETLDAHSVNVL